LDPSYADVYHALALVYIKKGQDSNAVKAGQTSVQLAPDDPLILAELGYVYGVSRRRTEAQAIITKLKQQLNHQPRMSFSLAVVYAGLGDKDQTCQWLERSYSERAPELLNLKSERIFDGVRADVCFQSLLRRLNF
jgi:Flp pilus assembly protein TadD